jgi:hypothetical protein
VKGRSGVALSNIVKSFGADLGTRIAMHSVGTA